MMDDATASDLLPSRRAEAPLIERMDLHRHGRIGGVATYSHVMMQGLAVAYGARES
jgi:hypothetical protein